MRSAITGETMKALWWSVTISAALALLPILYVLSCGPLYWLTCEGWVPVRAYVAFVDPIDRVLEKDGALYDSIVSYIRVWHAGQPPGP